MKYLKEKQNDKNQTSLIITPNNSNKRFAQSTGDVEYIDCFSPEG